MNIGAVLSRAIKQGAWVYITYRNTQEETTYFWISILDINIEEKTFQVFGFNYEKSKEVKQFDKIYFDRILSAQIIEGTYYKEHMSVIQKIDENFHLLEWMHYYDVSEKVLTYYEQCYNEDVDVEEDNFTLLEGFDEYQTDLEQSFILSEKQRLILLKLFKNKLKAELDKNAPSYEKLTYSLVAIKTKSNKLIPLFYYDVKFDITNNKLILFKTVKYNLRFKIEEKTFQLEKLVEADLEVLAQQYVDNKSEVLQVIQDSLSKKELVDTRPYLMKFHKSILVPISKDLNEIKNQYYEQNLSRPLNAFFGRFANINRRLKRINNLLLLDEKVNIEQLRAMYHALNQDVTYVQGPPGTGKTTLIKNVILSSLLNDRSVLVTSNNNEAIEFKRLNLSKSFHSSY